MNEQKTNYNDYIIDTNNILANKINFFEAKTKQCVVLNELNETNFKDLLSYIFINKFHFENLDNLIIKMEKNIKKFNDIKFTDFDINSTSINYLFYNINGTS